MYCVQVKQYSTVLSTSKLGVIQNITLTYMGLSLNKIFEVILGKLLTIPPYHTPPTTPLSLHHTQSYFQSKATVNLLRPFMSSINQNS